MEIDNRNDYDSLKEKTKVLASKYLIGKQFIEYIDKWDLDYIIGIDADTIFDYACTYELIKKIDYSNLSIEYTWSSISCETTDGLPFIGEYDKNQYILAGFNGHGFSHVYSGSKIIKDLIDTSKKVNKILLASDEDREGEAISYHICRMLKMKLNGILLIKRRDFLRK
jgi:hypothetical protein